MKQICIPEPYRVEVRNADVPQITLDDEILVKSIITGISAGTEMRMYRGTLPQLRSTKWDYWNTFPLFPGSDCVGTVIKKGKGVSSLNIGDRVVCLAPHQEVVKTTVGRTARLPETFPLDKALFTPLNTTAFHTIYRAYPRFGDAVIVIGAGVLGLLIFQNCKLAGTTPTIIADIDQDRLSMAGKPYIDSSLNLSHQDWRKEFDEIYPTGADLVIEATGNPKAILTALEMARSGGKVHIAGFHTQACPIVFGDDFLHKELTLTTSFSAGQKAPYHPRYIRRTLERNYSFSAGQVFEGNIQSSDNWITHRFPYSEIKQAYQMIDKKKENFLMVVLEWE